MATTLAAFIANLGNVSITGVTEKLPYPPASLENVGMPCQWVQVPQISYIPMSFQGGYPAHQAQVIIAISSVATGERHTNWDACLTMADTAAAALMTAKIGPKIASVAARPGIVEVGGVQFWGVIVDIQGAG